MLDILRPSSDTWTGNWYIRRTTTMSLGPPAIAEIAGAIAVRVNRKRIVGGKRGVGFHIDEDAGLAVGYPVDIGTDRVLGLAASNPAPRLPRRDQPPAVAGRGPQRLAREKHHRRLDDGKQHRGTAPQREQFYGGLRRADGRTGARLISRTNPARPRRALLSADDHDRSSRCEPKPMIGVLQTIRNGCSRWLQTRSPLTYANQLWRPPSPEIHRSRFKAGALGV